MLYLREREYFEEVNPELTFICLKKENDGTPMIIVQYDALGNTGTMSWALISYNKGKIGTQVIDPGMARMICVDPNNRTMCITINDEGNPAFEYYKVENKIASVTDKIKQSGEEDCKFFKGILNSYEYEEITEEEYSKYVSQYKEGYNFVSIETKLTDENIDRYVQEK